MSSEQIPLQASAPELPDDFARRVIARARAVQRRRRIGYGMAGMVTIAFLAAAIPIANFIRPASRSPLSEQFAADTDLYDGGEPAADESVGAYLMPNAAALIQFAAAYPDSSEQYDVDWTVDSDD